MSEPALEPGQVALDLPQNLQHPEERTSGESQYQGPRAARTRKAEGGRELGGTLGVMRWQPRRCAGMTTVFWAHLAAMGLGATGAAAAAAPVLRRC